MFLETDVRQETTSSLLAVTPSTLRQATVQVVDIFLLSADFEGRHYSLHWVVTLSLPLSQLTAIFSNEPWWVHHDRLQSLTNNLEIRHSCELLRIPVSISLVVIVFYLAVQWQFSSPVADGNPHSCHTLVHCWTCIHPPSHIDRFA